MTLRIRSRLVCLVATAVVGLTCAFPTDKSDQVSVVIQSPTLVVIRGAQLPLFARAFRVNGTDTVDVENVTFRWTTGNASLATVQDAGGGYAQVTGVNSGMVEVMARAVAFEQSDLGSLQVRVSNPLEVDSVRPSIVRFGDTITVYGVGVDSIFIAFLENATLFDYPIPGLVATRIRDSLGYSRAVFWVPPPARTERLSFIGPGVFGNAPDTTRVFPIDALEMPNEAQPRVINLDAPPRFPAFPFFRFLNPALAFEIPKRDQIGVEWYRFDQTNARDLTLIMGGPEVQGKFLTFLTDSLAFTGADSSNPAVTDYTIGPSSWTIGPQQHACKGFAFEPAELEPDSTIVALRGMPPGTLHAWVLYAQPGRYGLAVLEGYIASDPTPLGVAHEEDDFCDAADPVGQRAVLPFRDTLGIDNPHDIDWIRFTVPGGVARFVQIQTRALVSGPPDSTDIDLFLLTVPGGGASASLDQRGTSGGNRSDENIGPLLLTPGDYYLVALDYVGAPTLYEICIGLDSCALSASPPASLDAARPRRESKRAPPTRAPGPRPARSP